MSVIMRIVGMADGTPTPFDDQWLLEYDPEQDGTDPDGFPMSALLLTTPDRSIARRFTDAKEALACWRRVCQRDPHGGRPDGGLNRPLTAFTIEVEPAEKHA